MKNDSGKTFEKAKIKLMAGDVNKIQPVPRANLPARRRRVHVDGRRRAASSRKRPLMNFICTTSPGRPRCTTARPNRWNLFTPKACIAPTIYVYDGVDPAIGFTAASYQDQGYGTHRQQESPVMREFVNAETNHLGMALPKGKLRFYRRDDDGQLRIRRRKHIDHTPRNETIRLTTGNAFDLVGERKADQFHVDTATSG